MFCRALSYAVQGIEAMPVQVEADISNGFPGFDIVGYPAGEAKEARERIRVALKNSGYLLPPKRITINLAPADMKKNGTAYDLPTALAVMCSLNYLPPELLEGVAALGELSLDGQVRAVPGVLSCVLAAKRDGIRKILVPKENAREAAMVSGIQVFAMESFNDALEHFTEGGERIPVCVEEKEEDLPVIPDFSEVVGQYLAKRAAEIAVAGRHNLLLLGPPGAGKTMLASRIPGIMPSMTFEESLELTQIYSVAGLLPEGTARITRRPFRSPHHTISVPAFTGGGQVPRPGEISLATHGVLFLDEFPEFHRASIEILRQPLEERKVRIARLRGDYTYPAKFMLVAAMNPCPCGYYPDRNRCHCTQDQIHRYLGKISQPILDRIDLCVEMSALAYEELTNGRMEERSEEIQKRILAAGEMQKKRFAGTGIHYNSEIAGSRLSEFCPLTKECQTILKQAFVKRGFSARSYHRMIRVARTIADLAGEEQIQKNHIEEAVMYHVMDQKYSV